MEKILNAEYAAIHGTYWMYYGVICSFASVYLLSNGYTNSEIGIILAVGNIVAVFLQPLVADLADRSKRISLIGISQLMTVMLMGLTFFMFVLNRKSVALSLVFILLIAWTTVLQPLFNSLNFKLQESGIHINFGMGRSMGSLAYSVLCAFLGTLVEENGIAVLPVTGEIVLVLLMVSLFLTKWHFDKSRKDKQVKNDISADEKTLTEYKAVSETAKKAEAAEKEINLAEFIKRNRIFMLVNIGVLGVFFSNSVLNNFMIQIVENVGGNSGDMGRIFSVMAFLEIPTMFCFEWFKRRFACKSMLKVAAVCFTLKIGACYAAKSVTMIFAAQFLQLFSFALFLPAMVSFIDEIMSKGEAVKGQALFTTMITVSSVAGSLIGGVILDFSGAGLLTLISTVVTAAGTAVVILTVDRAEKENRGKKGNL